MKTVKYSPTQGFPPSVGFQTSVGLISLTPGENPLSDEHYTELARLASKPEFSYGDVIDLDSSKSGRSTSTETPPPAPTLDLEISLLSAEDAIAAVAKIKDVTTLQALKEEEQESEKRSTVLKAIDKAIVAAKGA